MNCKLCKTANTSPGRNVSWLCITFLFIFPHRNAIPPSTTHFKLPGHTLSFIINGPRVSEINLDVVFAVFNDIWLSDIDSSLRYRTTGTTVSDPTARSIGMSVTLIALQLLVLICSVTEVDDKCSLSLTLDGLTGAKAKVEWVCRTSIIGFNR